MCSSNGTRYIGSYSIGRRIGSYNVTSLQNADTICTENNCDQYVVANGFVYLYTTDYCETGGGDIKRTYGYPGYLRCIPYCEQSELYGHTFPKTNVNTTSYTSCNGGEIGRRCLYLNNQAVWSDNLFNSTCVVNITMINTEYERGNMSNVLSIMSTMNLTTYNNDTLALFALFNSTTLVTNFTEEQGIYIGDAVELLLRSNIARDATLKAHVLESVSRNVLASNISIDREHIQSRVLHYNGTQLLTYDKMSIPITLNINSTNERTLNLMTTNVNGVNILGDNSITVGHAVTIVDSSDTDIDVSFRLPIHKDQRIDLTSEQIDMLFYNEVFDDTHVSCGHMVVEGAHNRAFETNCNSGDNMRTMNVQIQTRVVHGYDDVSALIDTYSDTYYGYIQTNQLSTFYNTISATSGPCSTDTYTHFTAHEPIYIHDSNVTVSSFGISGAYSTNELVHATYTEHDAMLNILYTKTNNTISFNLTTHLNETGPIKDVVIDNPLQSRKSGVILISNTTVSYINHESGHKVLYRNPYPDMVNEKYITVLNSTTGTKRVIILRNTTTLSHIAVVLNDTEFQRLSNGGEYGPPEFDGTPGISLGSVNVSLDIHFNNYAYANDDANIVLIEFTERIAEYICRVRNLPESACNSYVARRVYTVNLDSYTTAFGDSEPAFNVNHHFSISEINPLTHGLFHSMLNSDSDYTSFSHSGTHLTTYNSNGDVTSHTDINTNNSLTYIHTVDIDGDSDLDMYVVTANDTGYYYSRHMNLLCSNLTRCSIGQQISGANETTIECEPCPPGRYKPADTLGLCSVCEAGRFTNSYGSSECYACQAGMYSNMVESRECIGCAPGTFADYPGSTECNSCLHHGYQNMSGATACFECESGYYSPNGIQCVLCDGRVFSNKCYRFDHTPVINETHCDSGYSIDLLVSNTCEPSELVCSRPSAERQTVYNTPDHTDGLVCHTGNGVCSNSLCKTFDNVRERSIYRTMMRFRNSTHALSGFGVMFCSGNTTGSIMYTNPDLSNTCVLSRIKITNSTYTTTIQTKLVQLSHNTYNIYDIPCTSVYDNKYSYGLLFTCNGKQELYTEATLSDVPMYSIFRYDSVYNSIIYSDINIYATPDGQTTLRFNYYGKNSNIDTFMLIQYDAAYGEADYSSNWATLQSGRNINNNEMYRAWKFHVSDNSTVTKVYNTELYNETGFKIYYNQYDYPINYTKTRRRTSAEYAGDVGIHAALAIEPSETPVILVQDACTKTFISSPYSMWALANFTWVLAFSPPIPSVYIHHAGAIEQHSQYTIIHPEVYENTYRVVVDIYVEETDVAVFNIDENGNVLVVSSLIDFSVPVVIDRTGSNIPVNGYTSFRFSVAYCAEIYDTIVKDITVFITMSFFVLIFTFIIEYSVKTNMLQMTKQLAVLSMSIAIFIYITTIITVI